MSCALRTTCELVLFCRIALPRGAVLEWEAKWKEERRKSKFSIGDMTMASQPRLAVKLFLEEERLRGMNGADLSIYPGPRKQKAQMRGPEKFRIEAQDFRIQSRRFRIASRRFRIHWDHFRIGSGRLRIGRRGFRTG